jgi:hypothetical protein
VTLDKTTDEFELLAGVLQGDTLAPFLFIIILHKYLGSRIESTESDIREQKAQAWRAINNLKKIWKSRLTRNLRLCISTAAIKTILVARSGN